MICNKCNKRTDGNFAGAHARWCTHKKELELMCICGQSYTTEKKRQKKFCSLECGRSNRPGMSQEAKDTISRKRKKWLAENKTLHNWKRPNKHESFPANVFKKKLKEASVSFISEYQPLEDRFFSIDIAFPDRKIGIEINGNQHYNNDKSLKPYYQERHDLIEAAGWKIFEYHYSIAYNNDICNKIIDELKNEFDLSSVDYSFYIKQPKKDMRKYGSWKDAGKGRHSEWVEKQQKYIQCVLDSEIDFSKFGWVGKVADIINQKPQKVNNWMKAIMPEFYEARCFKRVSHMQATQI